jgi:hypothetical protein
MRSAVLLQTPRDEHSAVFLAYKALAEQLASGGNSLEIVAPSDLLPSVHSGRFLRADLGLQRRGDFPGNDAEFGRLPQANPADRRATIRGIQTTGLWFVPSPPRGTLALAPSQTEPVLTEADPDA